MPKLIYMLPAYNEEPCLRPLLDDIKQVIDKNPDFDIQVLVIDDGSTDKTVQVAESFAQSIPLKIVQHEKNMGLRAAMMTGLRECSKLIQDPNDTIICMDADNTHHPLYAIDMAKQIAGGEADIVIASRYQPGSRQVGVPFMRQVYSYGARILFKIFLNLPNVRDYTCGYRAYRAGLIREALETYGDGLITRGGFACNDELICHLASFSPTIQEVPFILRYDLKEGESKLQLGTTISETLKMLFAHRKELRRNRKNK